MITDDWHALKRDLVILAVVAAMALLAGFSIGSWNMAAEKEHTRLACLMGRAGMVERAESLYVSALPWCDPYNPFPADTAKAPRVP